MQCSRCGAQLATGAKFCPACGTPQANQYRSQTQPPAQGGGERPAPPWELPRVPVRKKKSMAWVYILVAVVLLIGAGTGAFLWWKNQPSGPQAGGSTVTEPPATDPSAAEPEPTAETQFADTEDGLAMTAAVQRMVDETCTGIYNGDALRGESYGLVGMDDIINLYFDRTIESMGLTEAQFLEQTGYESRAALLAELGGAAAQSVGLDHIPRYAVSGCTLTEDWQTQLQSAEAGAAAFGQMLNMEVGLEDFVDLTAVEAVGVVFITDEDSTASGPLELTVVKVDGSWKPLVSLYLTFFQAYGNM